MLKASIVEKIGIVDFVRDVAGLKYGVTRCSRDVWWLEMTETQEELFRMPMPARKALSV